MKERKKEKKRGGRREKRGKKEKENENKEKNKDKEKEERNRERKTGKEEWVRITVTTDREDVGSRAEEEEGMVVCLRTARESDALHH